MTLGKILVVDDEPGVRSSLAAILADEGFEVATAENGEECLAIARDEPFQAIFLDIWMPGKDGIETLRGLRRTGVDAAVIMISGHATVETAVKATRLGAHDFVEKPLSLEKVMLTLRNALRARKLEDRNRLLREELRESTRMIGDSPAMREVRERIAAVAPTKGCVFIAGESGTGKDVAARAIHAASGTADEAFVEVACRSLPAGRAAEELFGRAAGADERASRGKIEIASDGTLLLDEVGALSAEAQELLLRFLETGRFTPIGGHGSVPSDVRVIATSERDLAAEASEGMFHAELLSKLSVVPITIPPLRDRTEDVPLLFEHYLERYAREYGRAAKRVEPGAMERLVQHDWPGNVRELRNVAERLVILVPGSVIGIDDLPLGPPFWGGPTETMTHPPDADAPAQGRAPATLHEARSEFERRLILERLEQEHWNVSRAAASLGIERSNLYRKMKALGIRASAV